MADLTHAFHIADLHIRRSDERAAEYSHVFGELHSFLCNHPSVSAGSALVVIAGDVFEDKRALDPYAERTFVQLVRALSDLAPVVIIPGNHDFAQTEPTRADRIEHTLAVMTTCGGTRNSVHYLRETGAHRVRNVSVCTASVYDTLSSTSGSGNVPKLPPFPRADSDPDAEFCIAVAHVTVRSDGGDGSRGAPMSWFRDAGHRTVMLGDEHTPRVWRDGDFVAAQPGSILAQTFGEPVRGHGVCVWDLAANTVTHHELANPFAGVSALRGRDGAILFRTRGRARTGEVTAAAALGDPSFPRTPRVRLLGDVCEHDVERALAPGIVPSSYVVHEMASAEEWLSAGDSNLAGRAAADTELREYATPERMAAYVREHAPDAARAETMAALVLDPAKHLALPSFDDAPAAVRAALVGHQSGAGRKKGASVDGALRAFSETCAPTRPDVAFVHLEGDYITAFERIDLNLETLPLTTLIDGPNGMGKSSFLDVLRISLYGIDGVCENRREFDTRRAGDKGARECVKPYNVVNAAKPSHAVARTRLTVRVREDAKADQQLVVIERHFGSGKDIKPCVRRAEAGTQVCSGATEVRRWASRYFGDASDVSMCAMLAQSRAASFVGMRSSARKELIERTLALDAISSLADALAENAKGREKAIAALDASLADMRADRPADVPASDRARSAAAVAAAEQEIDTVTTNRAAALASLSNARRAADTHASDPVSATELERRCQSAQRALESAPSLTETETLDLTRALKRVRAIELSLAALGPDTDASAAELNAARADLASRESALDEALAGSTSAEIEAELAFARDSIAHATAAATAVLEPHMPRPSSADLTGRDGTSCATRSSIDAALQQLRNMPAAANPALVREWTAEKTAWDELVARVGDACTADARRSVATAREREELVARESHLLAELGDRAELKFDDSCVCCRANRDKLACSELQAELAFVRDSIASLGSATESVDDALAHLHDVEEVSRRSDAMARRTAEWAKTLADDAARDAFADDLAAMWWGAYDAQEAALDAARTRESRCVSILKRSRAAQAARDTVDACAAALAAAREADDERRKLCAEKSGLDGRVSSLREQQAQHKAAAESAQNAADRVRYAKVVELDRRARELTAALADHYARRALDDRAADAADAWVRKEQRLLEIRGQLEDGKRTVDDVRSILVGHTGRGGYSAHVYENVALPRLHSAMNEFLRRTATFEVVGAAGGELEVRFEGADARCELNQLGGADRFLLELAARCALRQIGTPGFNWPMAFIDEGFVAFDAPRRDRIAPVLAAMVTVGWFSQLVITSHLEPVKAVCTQTFAIARGDKGSRLVATLM